MMTLFKAVTKHSGKFKTLFDNLFQHVVTANFTLTSEGIFLQEHTNQAITLSVHLPSACFEFYSFEASEPIHIGLGKNINEDVFKHVQSKDTLTMTMTNPYEINFEIENKDGSGSMVSIQIESIQNTLPLDEPLYEPCSKFMIQHNLFKQICSSSTPTLDVSKIKNKLSFQYATGRSTKTINIQSPEDSSSSSELVHQVYKSEQFKRISKIGSLVDDLKGIECWMEKDKPLYVVCCSSIGTIKLFIYASTKEIMDYY